jgi:hypothetical protein
LRVRTSTSKGTAGRRKPPCPVLSRIQRHFNRALPLEEAMRCTITKPFRTKLNLLEEEVVLKCSGGKGILQLCRKPVIEKGVMP